MAGEEKQQTDFEGIGRNCVARLLERLGDLGRTSKQIEDLLAHFAKTLAEAQVLAEDGSHFCLNISASHGYEARETAEKTRLVLQEMREKIQVDIERVVKMLETTPVT